MRIFVTGASGWIGSAVIPLLLESGHDVVGLARSDASAEAVARLGATVTRGDLDDVDALRAAAAASEGVVHLGYVHDFSRMEDAARTDLAAIEAFGSALEGTGHPLLIASGTLGLATGRPGTEDDEPGPVHPRVGNALAALALAKRGVRPVVVRFAPTVHGEGDEGFVATLARVAVEKGVSGWVGAGDNRWSAVHRLDAAALVRQMVESGPAEGSVVHAVGEEGIATHDIAVAIGRGVGVPARSIPVEEAAAHFGWIGGFFGMDATASSALTRQRTGWAPTHPGLLADLDAGRYPGLVSHS